jgi:hypothetical protein
VTATRITGLAVVVATVLLGFGALALARPDVRAAGPVPRPGTKVIANMGYLPSSSRPARFIVVRGLGALSVGCPANRATTWLSRGPSTTLVSVAPAGGPAMTADLTDRRRFAPPPSDPGRPLHQQWILSNYSKGTIESATITVALLPNPEGGCTAVAQATIVRRGRPHSTVVRG